MDSNSFLAIAILLPISLLSLFSDQAVVFGLGGAPPLAGLCSAAENALHGYQCQELQVTTRDGYIISMQRITKGLAGPNATSNKPVLLHHGLLVDGVSWLINSPQQTLPVILADNGFDVWILNVRGTQFSRQHVNLTTSDPEYWNWSWEDLAEKDLPSIVDFVFAQTGQQVNYIGDSMGTLVAVVALSQNNLVENLKSVVLLTPIAYISNITAPLAVVGARAFLGELIGTTGLQEFDLRGIRGNKLLQISCANPLVECYDFISPFTGENCCLNQSTAAFAFENEPQPTSVKNLIHFAQIYRSGTVSKFDYKEGNMMRYGQPTPPVYNLTNIPHNLPLFLSHGGIDGLSVVADVQRLLNDLQGHDQDKLKVQLVEEYGHADFLLAYNVKDMVYKEVIEFVRQFA